MKIAPWSFTNLSDFGNCRFKFFRKHVAKDLPPEEKSPEQLEGIAVHEGFEHLINQGIGTKAVAKYEQLAAPMIKANATAEHKYGVEYDGTPAQFFKNRATGAEPWGRGVVDVEIIKGSTAMLFDWKTQKVREDPGELSCQALLLKAHHPEVTLIKGAYVWLKENRVGQMYDLSNTGRVFNANKAATDQMQECLETEHWPKEPNALCGYCPVKDCEFNRS